MTDIFISYANEDRDRIRRLAEALGAAGPWSVFWDRVIPPGMSWYEVIGAELRNARCVVVTWSAAAVQSEWVREEADEGKKRKVLLPIFMDPIDAPMGFRSIQGVDLTKWRGNSDAAEFQLLVSAIRRVVGTAGPDATAQIPSPAATSSKAHPQETPEAPEPPRAARVEAPKDPMSFDVAEPEPATHSPLRTWLTSRMGITVGAAIVLLLTAAVILQNGSSQNGSGSSLSQGVSGDAPVQPALAASPAAAKQTAQQQIGPAGNWQSVRSETYSWPLHPVVTGAEFYLNIDVASDGSFRGQWGEYACVPSIGALGSTTFPCRFSASSGRASGHFGPTGQGVIELEKLGSSAFNWSTPSTNELAIDLPRNWRGGEAAFHRARMTRDGMPKPAAPDPEQAPLLSAPALYREFLKDERGTLARYKGQAVTLEGRRGALIQLSDGGAAIHVPDGYQPRALVLTFPRLSEVTGIGEGAQFRFRCTVDDWDYQYVHLNDCTIVR